MDTFDLVRSKDVSGISGTGAIAEGALFSDGSVALKWFGRYPVEAWYPSIDSITKIHGHEGLTQIVWHRTKSGKQGANGRSAQQYADARQSGNGYRAGSN